MEPLAYFVRGDGPKPVIMLHGFLGSGRNLASLAQRWAARQPERRILLCDLLGHGGSPPLPAAPTLQSLVPPVLSLIDKETAPVTLVGHSLGGRVALLAAAARLSQVARCVLLDISPAAIGERNTSFEQVTRLLLEAPAEVDSRDALRAELMAKGLSLAMADWLLMNLTRQPSGKLGWRFDRQALAALGWATREGGYWQEAAAVAAEGKLEVIHGGASDFVTAEDVLRLRALGAKVTTLAGAGHYVHVDAQEALLAALAA